MNKDSHNDKESLGSTNKEPVLIKEDLLYKGKFLQISKLIHEIPNDIKPKQHVTEIVQHTYISDQDRPSGVGIIAIIKQTRNIVFIENFRFPIDKKCIEFPSGIIDKEDLEVDDEIEITKQAGKRELKEETGYEGDFVSLLTLPNISKPMTLFSNVYHDPWKSSGSTAMALFTIDLDNPINKEPKPSLELEELIIKYEVHIDNLLKFITKKIMNEGYCVRSDLYSFALGIHFQTLLLH